MLVMCGTSSTVLSNSDWSTSVPKASRGAVAAAVDPRAFVVDPAPVSPRALPPIGEVYVEPRTCRGRQPALSAAAAERRHRGVNDKPDQLTPDDDTVTHLE
jgi:hypothetical protein